MRRKTAILLIRFAAISIAWTLLCGPSPESVMLAGFFTCGWPCGCRPTVSGSSCGCTAAGGIAYETYSVTFSAVGGTCSPCAIPNTCSNFNATFVLTQFPGSCTWQLTNLDQLCRAVGDVLHPALQLIISGFPATTYTVQAVNSCTVLGGSGSLASSGDCTSFLPATVSSFGIGCDFSAAPVTVG